MQDSVTIKVIQKAALAAVEKDEAYQTEAPGNPLLRRAAGKALQDLLDSIPGQVNQVLSRGQSTRNSNMYQKKRESWREWLDMKLLLVSSTSKRPEMLHSLKEDKREYIRVTLDRRVFFSRALVIAWHLVLSTTSLLDYAFDIPSSEWERYRFGLLVRTWGVQITGWLHLGLLMDKLAFDRRGKLITLVMLSLEGVAVALLDALIFKNDPFFFMLYGLYVLFSKSCPFPARLLLCFLALVGWSLIDSVICDFQIRQRKFQHIGYTAVVLMLTAGGIRMQEHLDHCASYYERHVQRQIDSISDFKGGNQKLLAKILPKHVVQLVSDGVSPIAEDYADVTVVFTDLQGFTAFSSRISPGELVELLNMLYSAFDETILDWGLHKVEVIGDAYFISSGCPIEDSNLSPDQHAMRAVEVALALQRIVPAVCDDGSVHMRCGIHTGNVIAGVVGKKGPRFHLFGPNVEYANRMESTGVPGKVQISFSTKQWLDIGGHDYIFEDRAVDMGGRHDKTFLVTRSKARAAKKIRNRLAMQRQEMAIAATPTEPE